jgi:hypothetical protein
MDDHVLNAESDLPEPATVKLPEGIKFNPKGIKVMSSARQFQELVRQFSEHRNTTVQDTDAQLGEWSEDPIALDYAQQYYEKTLSITALRY